MRILLVVPTSRYGTAFPALLSNTDFPVGFAYLASTLRAAGHDVFCLNPNNDTRYPSAQAMLRHRLTDAVRDRQPDLIGLGGLSTEFRFIRDVTNLCRTLAPDVPIVIRGGIVNNDAPFVLDNLRPDFCILGEGEEAVVRLAQALDSGERDFSRIHNLGYRYDGNGLPLFLTRRVWPFVRRRALELFRERRHFIFSLIEDLTDKGESSSRAFATGCPKCHKRFQVNVGAFGGVAP